MPRALYGITKNPHQPYVKPEDMHDLFENKCHLAPSFGEWFGGENYATFVRLNLATSLENIKTATHSIIRNI